MQFESKNPFTGQRINVWPALHTPELNKALSLTAMQYQYWKEVPLVERISAMDRYADLLAGEKERLARTITSEMGKPLAQSVAEIGKCVWLCRYYTKHAPDFLMPREIDTGESHTYVRFDPVGAVFGIMPWNFPVWQAMRYAIPNILSGNVVLLKPASNVAWCAQMIETLANAAFGEGVFQTLLIDHDQVESVISNDVVRGVTLTGSDRAGKAVAALAGKYLKKTVLELGGSDPFLILEDAQLENAVDVYLQSRMHNTGQTCIAAKRLIVHKDVYGEVVELIKDKITAYQPKDPLAPDAAISCMARSDLAEGLQRQVDDSVGMGAEVLVEGGREGETLFHPVCLAKVTEDMPVLKEEIFGPVVVIQDAPDESTMIALANRTMYGLGCSIWSRDHERAEYVAAKIDAGSIHINAMVKSDPRVPFGGVKDSGYGRELGLEGIREFVNVKSVTIA